MKLNRREQVVLVVVVLSWALAPLALHFLLPEYEGDTGLVMIVGLLVIAGILVKTMRDVARRHDLDCRDRLTGHGFQVIGISPDLLEDWIPFEHRDPLRTRFDGFPSAQDPSLKDGYRRAKNGLETVLFGYSYMNRRLFTVMRLENPEWSWPEFACSVGSRWSGAAPVPGWERIRLEDDPNFSSSCWLQSPTKDSVASMFGPALRRLVMDHPKFRICASGHVLMLYTDAFRLVPNEAEAFVEQADRLAACWERVLGISSTASAGGGSMPHEALPG